MDYVDSHFRWFNSEVDFVKMAEVNVISGDVFLPVNVTDAVILARVYGSVFANYCNFMTSEKDDVVFTETND